MFDFTVNRIARYLPVFAPEDGTGSDDGGNSDGGDDDVSDDGTADGQTDGTPKDGDNVVLGGGTADGDDNPDDTKDDGDESSDDKDGDDEGAPEEYDFSGDMPEGVEVDEDAIAAYEPIFRELGLTQEQASKLVALEAQRRADAAKTAGDTVSKLMADYVTEAKADKEIGGDKWEETVRNGNAVLNKFGTERLIKEVMIGQGVGNHPEVIRFFARIATAVGEDTLITGENTDTGGEVSTEQSWYGSTTPSSKKG